MPQSPMPSEPEIRQFLKICSEFYPDDAVEAPIAQQRLWYDLLCARFDRPLPVQYVEWLGKTLRGDFGESIYFKTAAAPLIGRISHQRLATQPASCQ